MKKALFDSIDRDGYVVVAGALDAAMVARLRRAFEDAPLQSNGTQHVELGPNTEARDAWEALRDHPIVRALTMHVLVLGAAFATTELHGRNPLPGYGQQGLHADAAPRATVEPFLVVTAIWMFDDFTVENGATRVVPGTHRLVGAVPKSFAQPTALHPDEIVVTAHAGSVLVLNGHTWHSGRKNESSGPRRAAQLVQRR